MKRSMPLAFDLELNAVSSSRILPQTSRDRNVDIRYMFRHIANNADMHISH